MGGRRLSLEVEAIVSARTSNAEDEIAGFEGALNQMMATIGRTSDLLDDQSLAFHNLTKDGRELSDVWNTLDRAADSTQAKLLTQKEAIDEYILSVRESNNLTEEQVQLLNSYDRSLKENNASHKKHSEALKEERDAIRREAEELKESELAFESLVDAYERGNAELQDNVKAFNKLTNEGREMSDEWNTLDRNIDRLYGTLVRQREELERNQVELLASNLSMEQMIPLAQRYEDALGQLTREQEQLYLAMKRTRDIAREEARALEEQEREAEELTNQVRILNVNKEELRKTAIFGGVAGVVGGLTSAVTNALIDAFYRMIDAVREFAIEADKSFAEAEESALRLKAQVFDLNESYYSLILAASDSSVNTGFVTQDTIEATRKALNLNLSYAEAQEAVNDAAAAARVANVDLVDTLVAGTSASIAYQGAMGDTGSILDYYAFATQQSNLEMGDLVNGMTAIISPAAEANLGIRDITASMVAMSRIGDDFKEIQSLLGNLLIQLSVGGTAASDAFKEAAGVGFKEFLAQGNNIVDVLELLDKTAKDAGISVTDLLGGGSKFFRDVQAGRGGQELVQQINVVRQAYEELADVTGTAAEQAEVFEGSMYELNRELEVSKENAEIFAGGAFGGLSRWWKESKKTWYDFIAEQGKAKKGSDDFARSFAELTEQLESGTVKVLDSTTGLEEVDFLQLYGDILIAFEQLEEINTTAEGIDYTGLQKDAEAFFTLFTAFARSNTGVEIQKIFDILTYEPPEEPYTDMFMRYAQDIPPVVNDIIEPMKHLDSTTLIWTQRIKEAREEYFRFKDVLASSIDFVVDSFDRAYTSSLSYVEQIKELMDNVEKAETPEDLTVAEDALAQFNQDTVEGYQQSILTTIAANEGYSVSLIGIAEALGLITPEIAEQQTQFILMATQVDALAKVLNDQGLSIKSQAEAIKYVTEEGLTAEESLNKVQKNLKDDLLDPNLASTVYVRAGVYYDDRSSDPYYDAKNAIENDVIESTVTLLTDPAKEQADILAHYLDEVLADRELTVTLKYEDPGAPSGGGDDGGGGGGGGGGSDEPAFTPFSPNGINNTGDQDTNNSGITIVMNTNIYGNANASRIVGAQRDMLQEALVQAGLG